MVCHSSGRSIQLSLYSHVSHKEVLSLCMSMTYISRLIVATHDRCAMTGVSRPLIYKCCLQLKSMLSSLKAIHHLSIHIILHMSMACDLQRIAHHSCAATVATILQPQCMLHRYVSSTDRLSTGTSWQTSVATHVLEGLCGMTA